MSKKALRKKKERKLELRKMVLDGIGHDWHGKPMSLTGGGYLMGEDRMAHHLRAGYKDPTLGRSKGTGGGKKSGSEEKDSRRRGKK